MWSSRRGLLATAAALVALSGCFWPSPGGSSERHAYNAFETRINVATVEALEPLWQATLDRGPVSAPITSTSGVHAGDPHSVSAVDRRTGSLLWQHDVPPPATMWQPYVWRDRVLASEEGDGNGDSRVVELDARSGDVQGELPGVLVAQRGNTAVTINSHYSCVRFACFYEDSMAVRDLVTGEGRGLGVYNSFGLDPGSQIVTLGADRIYHAGSGPTAPCDPLPSLGLRAYPTGETAPGCGITTLTPEWQVVPGPAGVPVLSPDGTTVYVGRGQVGAFDAQTGAELWRTSTPGSVSDPAVAGGLLFVASGPYQTTPETLYAFAASGCGAPTCAPVWSATLGAVPGGSDEATLQPAVAGGVVFVAGSGGMLNAFDAAGCGAAVCTPIWTAAVGSEITGAPAVSDGQLYVGTADGRLVAFGLTDG